MKPIRLLISFLSLLLLLRLAILLTGVESVSHDDELGVGTMARELAMGHFPSVFFYQIDPYSGGSLLWQALVIPFFLILGENLFALKMVPLLFSILTLGGIYWSALRHFGYKTAVCASLLYVFAAPSFVQLSSVLMAGHSEDFFFQILVLGLFFEYLYKGQRNLFLTLSGLIAGLGIWIYYANAVMAAACAAALFLNAPKLFLRRLPVFALPLLLGFSPWLILNAQNHFLGLGLLTQTARFAPLFSARRLYSLFTGLLPFAFSNMPVFFLKTSYFSAGYFSLLLAAISPCFIFRSEKMRFFILYIFVFCAAFALSDFFVSPSMGFVGLRYLTPLLGMLLVSAGIGLGQVSWRRWLLIPLLGLGLAGQTSLAFKEPFAKAFQYRPVSYFQLGTIWYSGLAGRFENYEALETFLSRFPKSERRLIFWGLVHQANLNSNKALFEHPNSGDDLVFETAVERAPDSYRSFIYEWLGVLSRKDSGIQDIPEAVRPFFYRGQLFSAGEPAAHFSKPVSMEEFFYAESSDPEWKRQIQKLELLPAEQKSAAFEYLGYFYFTPMFDQPDVRENFRARLDFIPRKNINDVFRGMGWKIRERFREDERRALDWIHRLPEEARPAALSGAQAFDAWYSN